MSDEIKELTLIEALLKMGIDFSRRDYCASCKNIEDEEQP